MLSWPDMIRMRSLQESPPHGWMAEPPIVPNVVRDWSFSGLCRKVHAINPSLTETYIRQVVDLQNANRCVRQGANNFVFRDPESISPRLDFGGIIIRRSMANGDAIAATCVADALIERGFAVTFQTDPAIIPLISHHPRIKYVFPPTTVCDIDLDGAYEQHPYRYTCSYGEIFLEKANRFLLTKGVTLPIANCSPELVISEPDKIQGRKVMEAYPRPWTIICPSSFSFANRTVPDSIWQYAAPKIDGTKFWLGRGSVPGIMPLATKDLVEAMRYIANANLMVTVDTGPMHVAAALGTPMVAIEQASRPELHLSDQRDFIVIRPDLDCLNCLDLVCKINADNPPCRDIPVDRIVEAANKRLRATTSEDVSAVVCTFQASAAMLNHCLSCLLPQVQEIIVSVNHNGFLPEGTITDTKIKVVYNKTGRAWGYGQNANYGARHSNGKWILLVNDDAFLYPEAVKAMLDATNDSVGLVGQLLFYPDGTIQHGGTYRNPGDSGFGHLDLGLRTPRITEPVEMENITLASGLVRRSAFFQVRGFDERYKFYCEDNDLCMKLRKAGWKIMYQPKAKGIHQEHQSTKKMGAMYETMLASQKLFGEKWSEYFDWNRNRIPGNFEYLKK